MRFILFSLILFSCLFFASPAFAATNQTATLGATSNNSNGWTNPSNAHGLSDDNVYATTTPPLGGSVSGDWGDYGFDSAIPTNAEITKVEIIPQYHMNVLLIGASTLEVQAIVGGSSCGSAIVDSSEPATDTEFVADVTSCKTWSRADLLDGTFEARITATRSLLGLLLNDFELDYVKVRVTYDTPDVTQSAYRFYANLDSTDVGAALASQDAPTSLSSVGEAFRLRVLLHSDDAETPTSDTFKLQFVDPGSGSCASPTGGTPSSYTDVTGSTVIAFNTNTTPADGATLTTNANDPTHSGHTIISQSYEEANPANVLSAIPDGNDGLWDFSLIDNGSSGATSYCFRAVYSDNSLLGTYSTYPEVTPVGTLTVDIVDASGISVTSPSVSFTGVSQSLSCNTTSGTLGVSAERIRVFNDTDNPLWSLSIAASGGSTAVWDSGTSTYDFNDPSGSPAGCSDGGDSDAVAGQLTLSSSLATITPQPSCTATGTSLGSNNSFSEGLLDSIILATGSASSDHGCYFDITDIPLLQTIPQEQGPGSYDIDFTITVVAL